MANNYQKMATFWCVRRINIKALRWLSTKEFHCLPEEETVETVPVFSRGLGAPGWSPV